MFKEKRKVRQCPHCKGKTGFSITTFLGGTEEKNVTFKGKIITHERNGADDVERFASCLDCGKNISADVLDLKNV